VLAVALLLSLVAAGGPPQRELLPNLVELPPAYVHVQTTHGRQLLRFASTAANDGAGPIVVSSRRASPSVPFTSVQRVSVAGGGTHAYPLAVTLRYTRGGGHDHFHLLGFETYELRDTAGSVVLRGHKAGFCLGDRQPLVVRPRAQLGFVSGCGYHTPKALSVVQGISPNWSDPYGAELDGQAIDITGLAAAEYVLVNTIDPRRAFRESRTDDNAGSVRIAVTYPQGPGAAPAVAVLRSCRSAACPPPG
jgi:hypothetical protein